MRRAHNRYRRCAPGDGPRCDRPEVMNFESLSGTALVVRETQIGRDAAERLRQNRNRAAIAIALEVLRPFSHQHPAFHPVGTKGRQFDTKVTVTAAQPAPADLIQRKWPSPQ